jgi:hypothetical protein
MISYAPAEAATLPAIREVLEGKSVAWRFHDNAESSSGLGGTFGSEIESSNFVESKPQVMDLPEDFDWGSKRIAREFIELEQKTLAGKASREEAKRYETMRLNRNKLVFADRYIQDYAEIQRLKTLSEKLQDLQKYLRPIHLTND